VVNEKKKESQSKKNLSTCEGKINTKRSSDKKGGKNNKPGTKTQTKNKKKEKEERQQQREKKNLGCN